jgi:hypothetical protein
VLSANVQLFNVHEDAPPPALWAKLVVWRWHQPGGRHITAGRVIGVLAPAVEEELLRRTKGTPTMACTNRDATTAAISTAVAKTPASFIQTGPSTH